MDDKMKNKREKESPEIKSISSSMKKMDDTTVIKNHMFSLDNKTIRVALIASGMYDKNMRLTSSFR